MYCIWLLFFSSVFPFHILGGIANVIVTESASKKMTCYRSFGPAVHISDDFHVQETPCGHIQILMSPQ